MTDEEALQLVNTIIWLREGGDYFSAALTEAKAIEKLRREGVIDSEPLFVVEPRWLHVPETARRSA